MSIRTHSMIDRLPIAVAAAASLGLAAVATQIQAAPGTAETAAEAHLMLAGTVGSERRQDNREERRDDRGNRQDNRQEARDEHGLVGKDKRDAKQEGRQEAREEAKGE